MIKVRTLIEAGYVVRCHTIPSTLRQTIGQHSYGVALLLEYIYPQCTKSALLLALTHDCAEIRTGDIPATAKWGNQDLVDALIAIEERFEKEHDIQFDLDPAEIRAVKVADMLDLLLFAECQVELGNLHFQHVVKNCKHWFYQNPEYKTLFPKLSEFV